MITVYLSSTSSPLLSQDNFEIDLSAGDTLPQNVQLYAAAVDTADGSAAFTFSWHLLRKPTGSGAALSSALISNPILNSVDVWGDYFLFCIATNTATSETSERDPLKAGSSAFLRVFVRSENLALVKPAPGVRDWFNNAYEWVDALEDLGVDRDDHETRITALEDATPVVALADLSDVNLSTLSSGESLVWDGTEWVNQMVSGGSGGSLSVLAESGTTSGTVDLSTEALSFTGSGGVVVSGSTATAGEFTVDVSVSGTLAVDISGEAATAAYAAEAGRADEANFFTTANVLSLAGDLSGSATIGGVDTTPTLTATIVAGSVENSMLVNSGITMGTAAASEVINLGDSILFAGTTSEVEVDYSTAANTLTIGLPSSIAVNAATATTLQTTRTIALTGGATGSASFNGSANASISTTLATPTTSVRGGATLELGTAYGNSSGDILNRERVIFNELVDTTHYETSTTANHTSSIDGISEDQSLSTNIMLRSVALFRNPFGTDMSVEHWSIVFGGGGVNGGDGEYQLELVKYANLAAVIANSYTASGLTLTVSGTDNSPKGAEANILDTGDFTTFTVAKGGYLGVIVNNDPKNLGHMMHVQIVGSRPIGTGTYNG